MVWEACTREPRSIGAAVHYRRFGTAAAAAVVAASLAVSICAIALVLGTDCALAANPHLITIDEQSLNYAVLVPVMIVVLALACVVFNGLTPSYVRRRRNRR